MSEAVVHPSDDEITLQDLKQKFKAIEQALSALTVITEKEKKITRGNLRAAIIGALDGGKVSKTNNG